MFGIPIATDMVSGVNVKVTQPGQIDLPVDEVKKDGPTHDGL